MLKRMTHPFGSCYNGGEGVRFFMEMKEQLNGRYGVRKSAAQKSAFIKYAVDYANGLGVPAAVETGGKHIRSRNIVFGDLQHARVLITAHYDTCARLPFSNFMTPNNWPIVIATEGLLLLALGWIGWLCGGVAADALRALSCPGILAGLAGWVIGIAVSVLLLALMLVGPANPHNANDNTSGVLFVLRAMDHFREKHGVAYVLFDNEEKGLLGASAFIAAHAQVARRCLIVNMDYIGDGRTLLYTGTKRAMAHPLAKRILAVLEERSGVYGRKAVSGEFPKWLYPSDQMLFPRGTAFAALKGERLLYLDRIHTARDTVLDETNLEYLLDVLEQSL